MVKKRTIKRRDVAPRRARKVPGRAQPVEPWAASPPGDDGDNWEAADQTDPGPDVPTVVGIGASAGGLEAFSQLLESLPAAANVAIIFVQHLSPQHESALPTLLASKTRLPIIQVTEGLRIQPRHVYVIPPNVQMDIKGGVLHLLPRPYDRSQFTPIDYFFQSLARWAKSRAIGVILSGTASDGTSGIREIKAAGGITIAQQPQTAKYDGMPRSAIATGLIDLVLSPQEIAEQLAHIETHPYVGEPAGLTGDGIEPTDEQLGQIFVVLRRVSGIDFRQYKTPTVKRRLLRRMALHRLTGVDAYIRYLRENGKEATALYQDLLIHVTRFFREPESFDVLNGQVFPEIAAERSEDEPIRIWVPGCATGEEAYSVAISLMEVLGEHAASRRIQIFATDVSENAIEQARSGIYPTSISADVSNERLKRFFTKADGGYKINKALRDMCVFARHDLTRDPPFSRLDLVVCRNVMIYLDAQLQRRLISVFHYALRTRGFLMLGAAETAGTQHLFTVVDKRWRLYRKSSIDTALPMAFSVDRFSPLPTAAQQSRLTPPSPVRSAHDEASRFLLQRYSPPSVVIDENLQIVQFRGQTGHFLESASGEPNLGILKMAREGLLFPLKSALQSARRKRRTVRRKGVAVHRNGDWHTVNLEVVPLGSAGTGHLLVVFEEANEPEKRVRSRTRKKAEGSAGPRRREGDERVAGLTRELAASREYLQSIIQELEAANEELQSANEEILSSNEELQSTNEELDTAKEELQSTNEELNTVNEELHSRNDELSHVNSDLLNLLSTVDITILIVGQDMRIRRFTPTAERMLNLIPGDVGRPLGQINTNLAVADLEQLAQETIETFMPKEIEVQDRSGRWYSLRIRPYRNIDNRIDGAVLTLIDIGAAKMYQQQIEHSRDQLLQTVDLMREPVLVLDQTLHVKTANQSFYSLFGFSPAATVGKALLELDSDRFSSTRLHALALQLQGLDRPIENVMIDGDDSGAHSRLRASGRQFQLGDGKHWTVVALTPDHGQFEQQQPER
jgi:two-component system CheB/CheR fusion protein